MNGTILFPYDLNSTSPFAYFFAIELARKINHKLKVVSVYQPSHVSKIFFRRNKENESIELKKHLHLRLLELNGHYLENYNQWGDFDEIKIKCSVKPGNIEEVLTYLMKQHSSKLLLVDYTTFSEKLLSSDFLNKIRDLNFKLWIMPQIIEGFKTRPDLSAELFDADKKELFSDYLRLTKLYNIPNDLHLIKRQHKSIEMA